MAELKYTKHLLGKIEDVFSDLEYTIRYAKGNFQSGYCIVENQKVVVVNKFYETEGRINVLIDILERLKIEDTVLSEKSFKTLKQVMKSRVEKELSDEEIPGEEVSAEKEVPKEEEG